MKSRYIIGIDLGTTNSAVGYIDLHDASPGSINIVSFNIPQLVAQGRMGESQTLPSFIYLPGEYDMQQGAVKLPWDSDRSYASGVFARDQGSRVPGRLISSAKSWLCHGGVDREAPILPWGGGAEVDKISPVEASSRFLLHLKEAWNYKMPLPMEEQEIVLTVPASFDEVARELTVSAAEKAGLNNVTLLEEPLAAFYSWLSGHEDQWGDFIEAGERLLVCDVGGGTTDFTIVGCIEDEGGPRLERLAVGDHLLLGGDNVDLALTTIAESKISADLDHLNWQMLYHQCRQAKEKLLSEDGPDHAVVRVSGRGSSLVGSSITTALDAKEVSKVIIEGFYPLVELNKRVMEYKGTSALREMGLPYEKDAAITRHLAKFILRQGEGIMPSALLLNGGSLTPAVIQKRLVEQLSSWSEKPVKLLETVSLDLAISRGAVYYGLVRHGLGLKVGGGIARSYYAGVSTDEKDNKGDKAVCIVERGTEEGAEVELENQFNVLTNRPVKFSLYCSSLRKNDKIGNLVEIDPEDFVKLPALQTVLKYGKKGVDQEIPVKLGVVITTLGTLELYCNSVDTPHQWRLQFQLRDQETLQKEKNVVEGVRVVSDKASRDQELSQNLTDADKKGITISEKFIRSCFGPVNQNDSILPGDLPGKLVEAMGMDKDMWSLPVLRALADILLEVRSGRKKSSPHESRWFNLAGFCLRPGSGEVSDPWRIKTVWSLYFEGLVHQKDVDPRLQWWIFWRRVAAGLSRGQQSQMFSSMSHGIVPVKSKRGKKQQKQAKKFLPEEVRQMWLYASSLERLEISTKIELGRRLVQLLKKTQMQKDALWGLGRIAAREPLYGPADRVVPPGEASVWLEEILKIISDRKSIAVEAVISIARLTGDRARDLPLEKRENALIALQVAGIKEKRLLPLKEYVSLDIEDRTAAFGESLPEGLSIPKEETD